MTLTKDLLVESICKTSDLQRSESRQAVEALFEIIKQNLAKGEDILISGFGKFCVQEKKPRKGRNPQTGEDLFLDGRRVVTFRCSSVLREKVKGNK
jgi:integration host factor subunit alpha